MSYTLHHHTPSLTAQDPRGLAVRAVAYHRRSATHTPDARISRQIYSPSGFLLQQWDARLAALKETEPGTEPNQRVVCSVSGKVLHSLNVDCGQRTALFGAHEQILDSWDAAGTRHSYEYDPLLRPTAVFERGANAQQRSCIERFSYCEPNSAQAALNRSGRLRRHDDLAGTRLFERYDLSGNPVTQSRRFIPHLTLVQDPDMQPALPHKALESEGYTTRWQYGALGQLLAQIDAKGNRQQSGYEVDGLLVSMAVVLNNGQQHKLLQQRRYTASANVETEQAGNGVHSVWTYDAVDGRLQRFRMLRYGHPGSVLQDLSYTYDRIGQVLSIHDAAQSTLWSDNTQIEASSTYAYDTLYQLIEATGRESSSHVNGPALPGRVDFGSRIAQQCRQYRQHYSYDAGGNLLALQHVPTQGTGYTRRMTVSASSNHSLAQGQGISSRAARGSGFDLNGNQQVLEPGQALHWNLRDQLHRVVQVVREDGPNDDEIYCYDGDGLRVLKARRTSTHSQTHLSEVRYLPGLEIRRNSATGEWLNVVTVDNGFGSVRVLQWEQGLPADMKNGQVRYSVSDHLGSSTLELDQGACLLSQESFYPYGATAWWASLNAIESTYKTVRFSGKERDASGLYYFGFRYYAPWLMRWISADPAGDADGMNLYAMARGNPINRADAQGLQSLELDRPDSHFSAVRSLAVNVGNRVRHRVQIASSAAIRDALSTYISNAVAVGLDMVLFEGRQPTARLNSALRSTVAALDALAMMHMTGGLLGNVTGWSPLVGFVAAGVADIGFEHRGVSEAADVEQAWDPVARVRLSGHVRSFTREIVQQTLRGLGDTVSWGQTPLRGRVPRTLLASAAYGLATVPNALFAGSVPAPLMPNVSPLIEAYDALAGSFIRSGHETAIHELPQQTLQLPPLADTLHGGMSRMFNQTWTYWAGVLIEAFAASVTGAPAQSQSSRARACVAAARGVVSAITEFRGLLLQSAKVGLNNIARLWRRSPA